MKTLILGLLCCTALVVRLPAQTNQSRARLALIVEDAALQPAADLLTVELTKKDTITLLERTEIQKVYQELGLSAGNKNYLKLGQVLGADGLVLLEKTSEGTGGSLSVQLVAVKPGVLLSSDRFPWPIPGVEQWASVISVHFDPLLPKLGVLEKEALPISVVNLRSPIQTSESREFERQLTLMATERLSREKRLFVLERRKMQLMTGEKELKGLDDSAFWDGSYLLDGVVDRNGYTQDKITISARLSPPKGGTPLQIEASGSRTNFAEVINKLAEGILKALAIHEDQAAWNPADEADQFHSEGLWAMKWSLYPEAQAAFESAWALGRRTPDTAQLLVRSYTETISDISLNGMDIPVFQIPDVATFLPVNHGMEFILRNKSVLFTEANAFESFKLGLRLLRQGFGQLESYYYAAELRAERANDLLLLRDNTRQMLNLMNAQVLAITNKWGWIDPRDAYKKLIWSEAGIAFEQPEDALAIYHDLLIGDAKVDGLPRIIGWTWSNRRRAPEVTRRFVAEVCASTNVAVQMEGLFLAFLLAPDDVQESSRKAEEKLLSALWDNRQLLFQDLGRAKLVERTRQVLEKRTGQHNINKPFDHEPFASFKHRVRMGFLADAANTNAAVLEEFFPNTNVKMETPEQARELVPLMEAQSQNPAFSGRINGKLAMLRSSAGEIKNSPASAPSVEAAPILEARFIPWKLSSSDTRPTFNGMIYRNGRLWVRVRYLGQNGFDDFQNYPASYIAINPQRGVTTEISFPEEYGFSGSLFDVSETALFAEAGGFIYEYKFREKNWTKIPVTMEGANSMVWRGGRLFIGRRDGLLEVNPESANVKVLASTRRTPPANEIDPLWSADVKIFPLADGRLGALTPQNYLIFDPAADHWSVYPISVAGTNAFYQLTADYFSPEGAQRLLTGMIPHRYLIGFRNDGGLESLLMEETGLEKPSSVAAEKPLPPLHWDWPKGYSLEHSQFVTDGKTAWALLPTDTPIWSSKVERARFSDKRDATLLWFKSDERTPRMAAVRFSMDQLPNRPIVNGQPTGIFYDSNYGDGMMVVARLQRHVGNMAIWLRVPGGLLLGGDKYCGHWFISDEAMENTFTLQRELKDASPNPQALLPNTTKTQ